MNSIFLKTIKSKEIKNNNSVFVYVCAWKWRVVCSYKHFTIEKNKTKPIIKT